MNILQNFLIILHDKFERGICIIHFKSIVNVVPLQLALPLKTKFWQKLICVSIKKLIKEAKESTIFLSTFNILGGIFINESASFFAED